jgi:hypothetical protein
MVDNRISSIYVYWLSCSQKRDQRKCITGKDSNPLLQRNKERW